MKNLPPGNYQVTVQGAFQDDDGNIRLKVQTPEGTSVEWKIPTTSITEEDGFKLAWSDAVEDYVNPDHVGLPDMFHVLTGGLVLDDWKEQQTTLFQDHEDTLAWCGLYPGGRIIVIESPEGDRIYTERSKAEQGQITKFGRVLTPADWDHAQQLHAVYYNSVMLGLDGLHSREIWKAMDPVAKEAWVLVCLHAERGYK